MASMHDQLSELRSKVPKAPDVDPVNVDLEQGVAEIKMVAEKATVTLTEKDKREMIENHKKMQRTQIRERQFSMVLNLGMALLAAVTACGSAYAIYRGANGETNASK